MAETNSAAPTRPAITAVMIECPLAETDQNGPAEIINLPRTAARTLEELAAGLAIEGLQLQSGRAVRNARDAVLWLCEQIQAAKQQ